MEWVAESMKYLARTYPPLEDEDEDEDDNSRDGDGLSLVDELRADVCDTFRLSLGWTSELPLAKQMVFTLITLIEEAAAAASPPRRRCSRDPLVTTAIKLLVDICDAWQLLRYSARIYLPILGKVAIPNVHLSHDDGELFETNYVEFIGRDTMEGSDCHTTTRRSIACKLLRSIASHPTGEDEVLQMVSGEVQKMLDSFTTNPAVNWKKKDCAIRMVATLATVDVARGYSFLSWEKKLDNNNNNNNMLDVLSFFESAIVPELQSENVNELPVLKAGALKFFTMFGKQLPDSAVLSLISHVVRFKASESSVVRSYASTCIEKLFPGPS